MFLYIIMNTRCILFAVMPTIIIVRNRLRRTLFFRFSERVHIINYYLSLNDTAADRRWFYDTYTVCCAYRLVREKINEEGIIRVDGDGRRKKTAVFRFLK